MAFIRPGTRLKAQSASVSGTSKRAVTGTGAAQAQSATVVGGGPRVVPGSGILAAAIASIIGAGFITHPGTGAAQAQASTVVGSGVTISGDLPGDLVHDGNQTPEQIAIRVENLAGLTQSATATCRYKRTTDQQWTVGHPLFRVQPGSSATPTVGTVEDVFAWTIIDLEPGTSYDVEVTLSDGVVFDVKTLTTATRALPAAAGTPNKTITAGSSAAAIQTAFDGLTAGDIIQFEDGTYTLTGNTLTVNATGTQQDPIYIRGATRDGVILVDATGDVITLDTSSWIIIEDMTLHGSFTDGGTLGFKAFEQAASAVLSNIIVRNVTAKGVDKGFAVNECSSCMVYDCTIEGNNLWSTSPTDFLGSNITWNDAGIKMPGNGNVAFNCTLKGFGDTLSFGDHSGGNNTVISDNIHYYRNEIINSCDDPYEVDHGRRNLTSYDNRATNIINATSCDPLYGGPWIHARNIGINVYRAVRHKWNSTNSGQFLYNNTNISTINSNELVGTLNLGLWWQANNGPQQHFGFRNNVEVHRGTTTWLMRLDNTGYDTMDWTNNAFFADGTINFDGGNFSSLSNLQASAGASSPVFSSATRVATDDIVFSSDPFPGVTLGANTETEVTQKFRPVLDPTTGAAALKTGVAIPNITDGFTGPAPDRGAMIEGRNNVIYGDRLGTPAYVSALAAYEVAAMNGSLLPDNGYETLKEAGQADSVGSQWSNWNIVIPWSGGGKSIAGGVMYVHGGGHGDSQNNAIMSFDFKGDAKPNGWALEDISPFANRATTGAPNLLGDGRGNSPHSYDGCFYDHVNDALYRIQGSMAVAGGISAGCTKYNFVTRAVPWDVIGDFPAASGGSGEHGGFYEPNARKILHGQGGGANNCAFLDLETDAWGPVRSVSGNSSFGGQACHANRYTDPLTAQHGLSIGHGTNSFREYLIDWVNETVQINTLTGVTGDTAPLGWDSPSIAYDPLLDRYWIWGGTSSGGYTTIYDYNPATKVMTAHTLTGDAIVHSPVTQGSFGRYVFMSQWRMIGMCASSTGPAYAIRLPTTL